MVSILQEKYTLDGVVSMTLGYSKVKSAVGENPVDTRMTWAPHMERQLRIITRTTRAILRQTWSSRLARKSTHTCISVGLRQMCFDTCWLFLPARSWQSP